MLKMKKNGLKPTAIIITAGLLTLVVISTTALLFFKQPVNRSSTASADHLQKSEPDKLVHKYLQTCNDETCLKTSLEKITSEYGPEAALNSLQLYRQKNPDRQMGDTHQTAHEVGRQTATTFGINGKAFLLCPTSYNYGCQHGFFEKALGEAGSPKDAIEQICGQFEDNPQYSSKFQFYCYHGVGHGVMMSQAYDLKAALDICDSLKSQMAQQGCWQGVFMENVNASMRGEARKGVFSADDPLAPCDKVDPKYQHQCYINHSGHLMAVFANQVNPAATACLKADARQVEACLESIGLMVSNEVWQKPLLKSDAPSLEAGAWQLCQEFPNGHVGSCVIAAIDQILNFDGLNIDTSVKFCRLVDSQYRLSCYSRIGQAIRGQATSTKAVERECSKITSPAEQNACKTAGGLAG